jgi:hypothetical protein
MRTLPERLHDDGRHIASRQRYDIGRQKTLEDKYTANREVLQSVNVFPFKVVQDFASEIGQVIGPLSECFTAQRVKLLLPPAKDTPYHGLCIHQRSLEFLEELGGGEEAVEHHFMRAENVGEVRIELLLDATSRLLEFRTRPVERRPYPAPLSFYFVWVDTVSVSTAFKPVTYNPSAPHP